MKTTDERLKEFERDIYGLIAKHFPESLLPEVSTTVSVQYPEITHPFIEWSSIPYTRVPPKFKFEISTTFATEEVTIKND